MRNFRVILTSGASVLIRAKECAATHSKVTGELTGYEFDGLDEGGRCPLFLNIGRIDAIIIEGQENMEDK